MCWVLIRTGLLPAKQGYLLSFSWFLPFTLPLTLPREPVQRLMALGLPHFKSLPHFFVVVLGWQNGGNELASVSPDSRDRTRREWEKIRGVTLRSSSHVSKSETAKTFSPLVKRHHIFCQTCLAFSNVQA